MTATRILSLVAAMSSAVTVASFTHVHPVRAVHPTCPSSGCVPFSQSSLRSEAALQNIRRTTNTELKMGFNLPPPQEPKGPLDEVKAILPTILSGVAVVLFFASPIGGFVFSVFNSLFVLALLTPIVLIGGFQIWSSLFTVEAPCPSCGVVPVRAVKNDERDPNVCLNCGAFSRVNESGDGLELCNNPNDMMSGGGTMFDQLFGGGMGGPGMGGSASDDGGIFGNIVDAQPEAKEEQAKKSKRQGTIIDVEVERD